MSLHEIRSHNEHEIKVMLMSLHRLRILREGQNITPDMIRENPLLQELKNNYEEEAYRISRYREKHGTARDDS